MKSKAGFTFSARMRLAKNVPIIQLMPRMQIHHTKEVSNLPFFYSGLQIDTYRYIANSRLPAKIEMGHKPNCDTSLVNDNDVFVRNKSFV